MPVRHLIRSSVAALLVWLAPNRAIAQTITTLFPDAGTLPQSTLRVRQVVSWTRYDQFLGNGGNRNLGALLATDSLRVVEVPAFAPTEAAIRAASGLSNFRLTAGAIASNANARVVSAPLILEYGVTNRLTIGASIPLVETRSTVFEQLNPRLGFANVGPNPARLPGSTVLAANARLVDSVRTASNALSTKLSSCQATPTGAGCATILAQQAQVQALVQSSSDFATVLENLYGTNVAHPGQAFVPLNDSPAQIAINNRITSLGVQFNTFLGANPLAGRIVDGAALRPGANLALQQLFLGEGRDTVGSTDRTSIGDITLGATFQLLNSLPAVRDTTFRGAAVRLTLNGAFRIGTGQPANRNRLFDIGTGYGQNGVEGGASADIWVGQRLSATAVAGYTLQLGSINVDRVPNVGNSAFPLAPAFRGTYSAGDVFQLSVTPRYRVAGYLALTGQYSLLRIGADDYTLGQLTVPPSDEVVTPPTRPFGFAAATAQQVGVGFSYSTVAARDRRPGALPFEVLFTHLETIAGSGGPVLKTSRDQIELRLYFGRRR